MPFRLALHAALLTMGFAIPAVSNEIWKNGIREESGAQYSLAEITKNDASELAVLDKALQLAPSIDITAAFDNGTLETSVKSLKPLISERRTKPQNLSPTEPSLTIDPKAYVAAATVWDASNSSAFYDATGRMVISVCWINPDAGNERGRQISRSAVTATWEHHGNVRFVNWGKCASDSKGIKIRIGDFHPESHLGSFSDPRLPSMSLNFTFGIASMQGCQPKKDLCIHSIAVHEFGHALGFLHEQDSPETPGWCRRELGMSGERRPLESLKAKMVTDWDEYSVLDYCFDIYSRRVQLSDCDIAAFHVAYGKPSTVPYEPKCRVRMNRL